MCFVHSRNKTILFIVINSSNSMNGILYSVINIKENNNTGVRERVYFETSYKICVLYWHNLYFDIMGVKQQNFHLPKKNKKII